MAGKLSRLHKLLLHMAFGDGTDLLRRFERPSWSDIAQTSNYVKIASHCGHGLILESDERHAKGFGVDLLFLLSVVLLQFGLPLSIEAHRLFLKYDRL